MFGIECPPMDPSEDVPPETVPSAFLGVVDKWKKQLLDVSGRNRGLYFRETKTTTFGLAGEAADVWTRLVTGERVLVPRAMPPTSASVSILEAPDRGSAGLADDAVAHGRRVKALAERVRLAREEIGAQILYAVFGWLEWHDDRRQEWARSPLVFVPVALSEDRESFRIVEDDAIEVNPALEYILRSEHRVTLPVLEDVGEEGPADDLVPFLERVRAAVSSKPGWQVEQDRPVIDVFSFPKVALVQEIERSTARLWNHPLVRLLAKDGSLLGSIPALREFQSLDRELPPGTIRTVVSADSTQLAAIATASSGTSLVIQGPPGTGKSQTITNLIGEFLAQGKRVLFVAEKAVARSVVYSKLEQAELSGACLHFGADVTGTARNSGQRTGIVDDLRESLAAGQGYFERKGLEGTTEELARLRDELTRLAALVHQPLGRGGWITPFELLGRALVAGIPKDRTTRVRVPALSATDRATMDRVRETCELLEALDDHKVDLMAMPLAHSPWAPTNSTEADSLAESLGMLVSAGARTEAILAAIGRFRPEQQGAYVVDDLTVAVQDLDAIVSCERWRESFTRIFRPSYRSARRRHKSFIMQGGKTPANVETLQSQATELLRGVMAAKADLERLQPGVADKATFTELAGNAERFRPDLARWRDFRELRQQKQKLVELGIGEALEACTSWSGLAGLSKSVERVMWREWASDWLDSAETLPAQARDLRRKKLADLEESYHKWSQLQSLNGALAARPNPNEPVSPQSELGMMKQLLYAKRRPSLRKILNAAPDQVQRLRPCMLMSPLAVAQYLGGPQGSRFRFDVCIIDEASMIPTADVVVAASLAKQLVVCGDSKQMPPTAFFQRQILLDGGNDGFDEVFESVLEEASALLPARSLRWHYRSRDESLIAFSNAAFYKDLFTFPSAQKVALDSGVRFEYVADAVYGRGGSRANPREAERVVELLAEELVRHPKRSVGITAMSGAQEQQTAAALEAAGLQNGEVKAWLDDGNRPKNLETIQGDEYDTMILTLGYGRDAAGKLHMNFGPLGREGGERRLNVAVTRARWKTILVSSVKAGDIPSSVEAVGSSRLRDYLDYAVRGAPALSGFVQVNTGADTDSPFEAAVLGSLRSAGLDCVPQVGVGRYRIDIGIRRPGSSSDFVLGVECDGASYHAAASARDRDALRQQVLENMGWRIHRVWSTDWFRDPARELERAMEAYRVAVAGTDVRARNGDDSTVDEKLWRPSVGDPLAALEVVDWDSMQIPVRRAGVELADVLPDRLAPQIVNLVTALGPLHKEELLICLREWDQKKRLGATMRASAETGLQRAVANATLVIRGQFVWLTSMDLRQVPIRVSGLGDRPPEWIPPEEAAQVLTRAVQTGGGTPATAAIDAIQLRYGYRTRTKALTQLANDAVRVAVQQRWLVQSGDPAVLRIPA